MEEFDEKSFCVLPFIHLATHPIGTVTPCCIADMVNDVSTAKKNNEKLFLGKNNLDDIANSDNFNIIRKKMINNEFPSECKNCYFYEKNKVYSKRMESNLKFSHLIESGKLNTNEDGSLKKVTYKYVELRLGTVCNLKCITCNPYSSNKWNADVSGFIGSEFEKDYFVCDFRTEWYRSKEFYDDLVNHCDELEEVWINGGEPTLIKEHGYFLQKLIDNGRSKKINLHYSINLTSLPDKFINLWMEFNQVRLQLSIDDLYERNDYIRFGSKWKNIYNYFLKAIKHKDVFRIEICQTVSALNVFNINEFKKFFKDFGVILGHNFVHHPTFLHVSNIPDKMKKEIIQNLPDLTEAERLRLITELNNNKNETETFYRFIRLIDKKRKIKIEDYLNEWKEII